jgi:C-terminal processing protease CtpA/Prc
MPSFSIEEGLIRRTLRAARNRDVLIIDLRGNRGGHVAVLQELIGSLAANDVPIGTRQARDHSDPQIAKGDGNEAFTGRVFVLVDADSGLW